MVSGNWNDAQKFWSLKVRCGATVELLTCRHVVMATGAGGQNPVMPTIPESELYQGTVLHSAKYHNAKPWRGKAGIVIGTANTAHDVAKDMAEAGLSSVTMVQRSRTYVLPTEYFTKITHQTYNLHIPVEIADKAGYSLPYGVVRLLSMKTMHAMAKEEPERFSALERAGFRVERYGDIIWHICEKMGGHYMDVGCSDMIARGLIKMKSDALPVSYTRTGLLFSDGTEISADFIVFCTGFAGNMRTDVWNLFGSDVPDKVDDFWTLDNEGELKGAFKPPGRK